MSSVHREQIPKRKNKRTRLALAFFSGALAFTVTLITADGLAAHAFSLAAASAFAPTPQDSQTQSSDAQKSAEPAAPSPAAQAAPAPAENPFIEITRENNFGVALMNRQQFEAALAKFTRACILDPQSDIGCTNMGI
ncbi:MAG: hypothetical protein ACRD4M_09055, partial [Candidatus Acidiferrales bacterium]